MFSSIESLSFVLAGWLFTYLIHSTVLIVGIWLALRFAKSPGERTRNQMWKVALIGGIATSLIQLTFHHQLSAAGFVRPMELAPSSSAGTIESTRYFGVRDTPSQNGDSPEQDRLQRGAVPTVTPATPIVERPLLASAPRVAGTMAPTGAALSPPVHWSTYVLIAVALASFLASIRLGLRYLMLGRALADRADVVDDPARDVFASLTSQLRESGQLRRTVHFTHSRRLDSPVAIGTNEICVPTQLLSVLDEVELRAMFAHELAHLKRFDPLFLTLANLVESLLVFQPLNTLARRGLQDSSEYICDEWAMNVTGDGDALAQSLATVATWQKQTETKGLLPAMTSPQQPLYQRVKRLLDHHTSTSSGSFPIFASVTILAGLVFAIPGVVEASAAQDSVDEKGASPKQAGADLKNARRRDIRRAQRAQARAGRAGERAERAVLRAQRARVRAGIESATKTENTTANTTKAGVHLVDQSTTTSMGALDEVSQPPSVLPDTQHPGSAVPRVVEATPIHDELPKADSKSPPVVSPPAVSLPVIPPVPDLPPIVDGLENERQHLRKLNEEAKPQTGNNADALRAQEKKVRKLERQLEKADAKLQKQAATFEQKMEAWGEGVGRDIETRMEAWAHDAEAKVETMELPRNTEEWEALGNEWEVREEAVSKQLERLERLERLEQLEQLEQNQAQGKPAVRKN